MQYNRLFVLIAIAGCGPNYTSGKTQCSDKKECPSGYSCSDDGTTGTHYCVDNDKLQCPSNSGFYCSQSKTCWLKAAACSTVTYCGTAKHPGNVICASPGSTPDCNGDTCIAEVGTGTGGSGGTPGTTGDAGVIRDASASRDGYAADMSTDVLGRDSAASCTTPCPTGKRCYSGQCCTPPAAGGNCTAYPSCGCAAGQVCYPSLTTQSMACFTTNNLAEGADCSGGQLCQTGLGCFGGTCKRYCSTDSDCPAVGGVKSCDQTTWSSDKTNISGVLVCQRICDPAHPQSPTAPLQACPSGFNCSSDPGGVSYCFKASPLAAGSTCTGEADCPAGSYCTTAGTCTRYCLSNSDCASGTTCQFTWSPTEYAGSFTVGYCK
jgi:hypothetical protein